MEFLVYRRRMIIAVLFIILITSIFSESTEITILGDKADSTENVIQSESNLHLNQYAQEDRLYIIGDTELLNMAATKGWPGSGSEMDPITIDSINITSSEITSRPLIEIQSISYHVKISNSLLINKNIYSGGIYIYNVDHITIENNTIQATRLPVRVSSSHFTISNNNFSLVSGENEATITCTSGSYGIIHNNYFVENEKPINIRDSNNITISKNNFDNSKIIIIANSYNIEIESNLINSSDPNAAISSDFYNSRIINNTIYGNLGMSNSNFLHLENNTIYGGISVGANSIITNNVIQGRYQTRDSIVISGKQNYLKNNSLSSGILISTRAYLPQTLEDYLQDDIIDNFINGSLIYYGENITDQIIGPEYGQIILINANNVTITNLTLNGTTPISILYSNNLTISNNIILPLINSKGIFIDRSNDILIINNSLIFGVISDFASFAIELYDSHNVKVEKNEISGFRAGIYMINLNSSSIQNNTINTISYEGIYAKNSFGNIVVSNNITGCLNPLYDWIGKGIYLDYSDNNTIFQNFISSSVYGIIISYADNNTLSSNLIYNNTNHGILLSNSNESILINNSITYNENSGIYLYKADNNTMINNIINSNIESGIHLYSSDENQLLANSIYNNNLLGISMEGGIGNYYANNSIYSNIQYGIYLWMISENNTVEWNDFIDNNGGSLQSSVSGSNNTIQYNYWYDHTLVADDSEPDGILDSPYSVGGGNYDYYPLSRISHNILTVPRLLTPNGGEIIDESIIIIWNEAIDNNDSIVYYSVYYYDGSDWNLIIANITSLTYDWNTGSHLGGGNYLIKVIATNLKGLFTQDVSDSIFTINHVPSGPVNLVINYDETSVNLTWEDPIEIPSPILLFKIYRSTDNITFVNIANSTLASYSDFNVLIGIEYYYKITAVNVIGESVPTLIKNVFYAFVPSSPEIDNLIINDPSLTITWLLTANGGSPILQYVIYRSITSGQDYILVGTSTTLNFTDQGFVTDQRYYYIISAENAIGMGLNSTEVSVIPIGAIIPDPPQNVALSSDGVSVSISWLEPLSDGGSTIFGYQIYRSITSGQNYILVGTSTTLSFSDQGFITDQRYYYMISAENTIGMSMNSTEVSIIPIVGEVISTKSPSDQNPEVTETETQSTEVTLIEIIVTDENETVIYWITNYHTEFITDLTEITSLLQEDAGLLFFPILLSMFSVSVLMRRRFHNE